MTTGISGKTGGVIQTIVDPQANVSGSWRPIQQAYARVSGSWQTTYLRFSPVTHTYTIADGIFSETVPTNAQHLTMTANGGGAGAGSGTNGGGGGAQAAKTIAIASSDWGQTISFGPADNAGPDEFGVASTIDGTLNSGTFHLNAGGGSPNGFPGTATGGDTNTSGSFGSGATGGAGANGGPGTGGNAPFGNGHEGNVIFAWT